MKTFLLTTIVITQLIGHGVAGTSVLPEIPTPKLSLPQLLAIVQKQQGGFTNYAIVAIDWYKASAFQPRIGDGTYSPGGDEPDQYSWFVTIAYKDEATDKELKKRGVMRQFNEVIVLRIKDNGKKGVFVGVRT